MKQLNLKVEKVPGTTILRITSPRASTLLHESRYFSYQWSSFSSTVVPG
jgi:hypothetical protein